MENAFKSIKFDMGELPVEKPDEVDVVVPGIMYPGQALITKKGHRRELEITLLESVQHGGPSTRMYDIDYSFANFRPHFHEGGVEDVCEGDMARSFDQNHIFGEIEKGDMVPPMVKPLYFYVAGPDRKVHGIEVRLKYSAFKNSVKIVALYDRAETFTVNDRGDYSMRTESGKTKGSLLSEKDGVYLGKERLVRVYAEQQ